MVTREEIKELNASEKWWMFQGALIYIFIGPWAEKAFSIEE